MTPVIAIAFVFGLVMGSFLNVVIYRLPRDESVVFGRSRCRHCKTQIAWYDNIPLVSFVVLGGKCRACGRPIAMAYPIVEFLSGLIAAAVVWWYGVTIQAVWIYAFMAILLAITVIDWAHRIIPDELSLGGTVFGWIGAVVCLDITLFQSLIGSLVGAGILLVIAVAYRAIRKVDGMGGGDVKLMAMIGAFVGWQLVFPVLFVASLLGSIYGISLIRKGGGGKTAVAFGSFLAPAATIIFLFGSRLWNLYLNL